MKTFLLKTLPVIALTLILGSLASPNAGAWTMIDQNLDQVIENAQRDQDDDGLADAGAAVLVKFHSKKVNSFRWQETYLIEEWLTPDSNMQRTYPEGSLIALSATPMNPRNEIAYPAGRKLVAFVGSKKTGENYILSMKMAPIVTETDSQGEKRQVVQNAWAGRPAADSSLAKVGASQPEKHEVSEFKNLIQARW